MNKREFLVHVEQAAVGFQSAMREGRHSDPDTWSSAAADYARPFGLIGSDAPVLSEENPVIEAVIRTATDFPMKAMFQEKAWEYSCGRYTPPRENSLIHLFEQMYLCKLPVPAGQKLM